MSESNHLEALKKPLTLRNLAAQLDALLAADDANGELMISVDGTVASSASYAEAQPENRLVELNFVGASSPPGDETR